MFPTEPSPGGRTCKTDSSSPESRPRLRSASPRCCFGGIFIPRAMPFCDTSFNSVVCSLLRFQAETCHSSFPRNSLSYLAWFGLSDKVSWSQSRMFPTARGTVEHSRRVCCSVYTNGQHKDTCKLGQVIGYQHLRCPPPWWEMPVSTPVFLIPFLTNGQLRKGTGLASVTEFCRPHVTLGLHTRFLASGCPARLVQACG